MPGRENYSPAAGGGASWSVDKQKISCYYFSMSAKWLVLGVMLVLAGVRSVGAVEEVPEEDGDYAQPGRSDMRVRVFVHREKESGRPTTAELPVCSDENSNAVVGRAGWKLPSQVTYRLNMSRVPAGADWAGIVANAASTWSGGVGNRVSFTQGENTTKNKSGLDGQNIVAFGKTSGRALGVTYIRYYTATGMVADVDTIMNERVAWSVMNTCNQYPNTYDIANVLVHEWGHWMGLGDEYTEAYLDNTMYGYAGRGETHKISLTDGDLAGLSGLY